MKDRMYCAGLTKGTRKLRSVSMCIVSILAGIALAAPSTAWSGGPKKQAQAKTIAGWLERVTIPAAGLVAKAKLDSGAKTSSIFATDVEEFDRDGEKWVRFRLQLGKKGDSSPTPLLERKRTRRVKIKDHDDPSSRRQVVDLDICFSGRLHTAQFTLANRSNFLYPILLGRRFLKNVALIDASRTYLTDSSCPVAAETATPETRD